MGSFYMDVNNQLYVGKKEWWKWAMSNGRWENGDKKMNVIAIVKRKRKKKDYNGDLMGIWL